MISEFLSALILGGILGMVGQGMRVIVGLKKIYESLGAEEQFGNKMDWSRLSVSLVIGFIAGAFGMILKIDYETVSTMVMTKDFMLSIIAIGYMGVDFIEGMMKNLAGKFNNMPVPTSAPKPETPAATAPTTPVAQQPVSTIPNSDTSFGSGVDTDLPVEDQPNNPATDYKIPTDIPNSYKK